MSVLKEQLLEACQKLVDEKLKTIETAIAEAQNAANSETKSTAGDKHDTSRAMMQLEVEQKSKQLAEARKLKQALTQINPKTTHSKAQLGSIVSTSSAHYFISASIGKVEIDGEIYFAISAISPVGQAVLNKSQGDQFTLNGKSFTIESIC